mgnify:CR=1 FL=1
MKEKIKDKNSNCRHNKELRKWFRKNKEILKQVSNCGIIAMNLDCMDLWELVHTTNEVQVAQKSLDELVSIWVAFRIMKLEKKS